MNPYREPPPTVHPGALRRSIHWWAVGFVALTTSVALLLYGSLALIVFEPFFR